MKLTNCEMPALNYNEKPFRKHQALYEMMIGLILTCNFDLKAGIEFR